MDIFTSDLPNDQDMITALGSCAIPQPLFTDCLFAGVGRANAPILIAVERKKIQDITTCINDGRFMSQFQVCKEMGCEVMALIAEGNCRSSPKDGLLEVPGWDPVAHKHSWVPAKPTMMFSRFDQYLTELDYLAGIIVKRSWSVQETAAIIKALWVNFQKAPEDHDSLHQMFSAPQVHIELRRPSMLRRIAKELPNIGWERSRAVAAHFENARAMCNATAKEWATIEGIGKKTAEKVVAEINEKRTPKNIDMK